MSTPQDDALRMAMHKCEIMTVVDHLVAYVSAAALSAVRNGQEPDEVFATIQSGLQISIEFAVKALQPAWYDQAELMRLEAAWDSE